MDTIMTHDNLGPKWSEALDKARQMPGSTDEILSRTNAALFLAQFRARLDEYIFALIKALCSAMRIENHPVGRRLGNFLAQFTNYSFVYAPINNERIRRQKGAFIVCPPAKTEFWAIEQHKKPHRIRIPYNTKGRLLGELSRLGITRSYIFPELSELANEAKIRYPAR